MATQKNTFRLRRSRSKSTAASMSRQDQVRGWRATSLTGQSWSSGGKAWRRCNAGTILPIFRLRSRSAKYAKFNIVAVNGVKTKTRADFRDLMRRLHGPNGPFRASTRETPEMHVRFLAPDVAVMHSRFHIYGDIDESERTSIGTRVVRKLDGRWRTVAVQNTDLRRGRRH